MTRFTPACESLDARTLPSAVMGGAETGLIGLPRDPDDGAGDDIVTPYDLKALKRVVDEPTAGAHVLYQDVFIPTDASPDDTAGLHHGNVDRFLHATGDNLRVGAPLSVENGGTGGTGDDHTIGGGSCAVPPDGAAAAYDHHVGGGTWGIAVDDPEAGMLLPAVQKVRDAAARM